MQKTITLPQVELNLENAKIVEIRASVGDRLGPQDVLLSVETQKAVEDLQCGESGFLRALLVKVGDEVNVHDPLAVLTDAPDEEFAISAGKAGPERADLPKGAGTGAASQGNAEGGAGEKVRSIPAARRRAKELGIDLSAVAGSGPNGRISVEDVESYARLQGTRSPQPAGISARRKALIAQMEAGGRGIPQISISRYMDVTRIAGSAEGTTFTSRLVYHVARSLKRHEALCSFHEGDEVRRGPVDIAVAMDNEHGLVAPVVRGADAMSMDEVSRALADLRVRGKENRLSSENLRDGRFAITNLGMLGVDMFTPLVFSGQTAVLAIGRTNDSVAVRPSAWFTLAVDHRVVDGAEVARFLETLQGAIAGESQ
jgi:pyruvate dehydrogenase E2 component (dihydrolipoamide acetyltransferase)